MLLLDTDILIDVLRNHPPAQLWLQNLGTELLVVTGFTVMELLQDCRNQQEQQQISKRLFGYPVVWPQPSDCERALATYANFHLSDNLGILDALIAQTAVGGPQHPQWDRWQWGWHSGCPSTTCDEFGRQSNRQLYHLGRQS